MVYEKYICGNTDEKIKNILFQMINDLDVGKAYADMIRLRVSGKASNECIDNYYVAYENEVAFSRLWCGWGKHSDAIGNWGNFFTDEQFRGKGIGREMLRFWYDDFLSSDNLPLCFMCSAGTKALTDLYRRFGFRPAIEGAEFGFLYMPIKSSPQTFREFHNQYYKPSSEIYHRPASIGFRHEIDCLLRFTFSDMNLEFGIGELDSIEYGLLRFPERCGMLFSKDGHCIGWSFDGNVQIHPLYNNSIIINE